MPYYDGGTAATGINVSNAVIWVSWNSGSYTTTSAITNSPVTSVSYGYGQTWASWNATGSAGYTVTVNQGINRQLQQAVPETEEQKQLRERRCAEQLAIEKRCKEERDKAQVRAEKLLRENLSAAQLAELVAQNRFTLRTLQPDGSQRIYRIERGRSRNIAEVDDVGAVIRRLCAHPVEAVPDADTMLAQKLWLEADEEAFRRIANFS